MKSDIVGDVLVGARNHLATGKWIKGLLYDGLGNTCMMGAVYNQCDALDLEMQHVVSTDALLAILKQLPSSWASIPNFNDHESIELQDVLTVFDKALSDLGRLGDVRG